MSYRKLILLSISAALLAFLGTVFLTATRARSSALELPGFVYGKRYIYHIECSADGTADLRKLLQEGTKTAVGLLATSLHFHTGGEMEFVTLESGSKGTRMLCRFHPDALEVALNNQRQPAGERKIGEDLSKDTLLEIGSHGEIVSVRFDPSVARESGSFARTILASFQFVSPASSAALKRPWETHEKDPAGIFLVRYEPISVSGNGYASAEVVMFRKRRIREGQPSQASNDATPRLAQHTIPGGDLTAVIDLGGGFLKSVQGSQTNETQVAGKSVAWSKTTVDFRLERQETVAEQELSGLQATGEKCWQAWTATALYAPPSAEEGERDMERATLQNETAESLMAQLDAVDRDGSNSNVTTIFLKLKALLYLHPEVCDLFAERLATAPTESRAMGLLSEAFSEVGNPQAQASLIAAARARTNDAPAMCKLIAALGMTPTPTLEAVATVKDAALGAKDPDVRATALFSLGIMAHRLEAIDSKGADDIVLWLIGRFGSTRTTDDTRLLLRALGNAGTATALSGIQPFLMANTPEVRAAAVVALRFIHNRQVDACLDLALTRDPSARVREEASFALSFRPMSPEWFAVHKAALKSEKAASIRIRLLENLWGARQQFHEARQIVTMEAKHDADPSVRKAARQMMGVGSVTGPQ